MNVLYSYTHYKPIIYVLPYDKIYDVFPYTAFTDMNYIEVTYENQ